MSVTAPDVAGPGAVSPAAIAIGRPAERPRHAAPDGATWPTGGLGAYTTPG